MKENMTKKRKQFKENLINHKKELGLHFFWQSEGSVMYGCEKTWRKKNWHLASFCITDFHFSMFNWRHSWQDWIYFLYYLQIQGVKSSWDIKKSRNNCNCAIYSILSFFSLFLLFTISWFNFPWSVFYKLYKIVWANGFWEHKRSLSFETQRL